MLHAYQTSPTFYDDTPLSATALNIIRDNAMLLQGLSKRTQSTFSVNYEIFGFKPTNTLWKGGFMYRTGLTTARIIYVAANVNSGNGSTFKIYFDGVLKHSRAATVNETATIDIDITSGYTDKQIVTVECKFEGGNGARLKTGTYYIHLAYVYPLSSINIGTYPTIATFGDISAANLNTLSQASDWLSNRLNLTPYIPLMGQLHWEGTHKSQTLPLWYGTVSPHNGNNLLVVHLDHVSRNADSTMRLVINGQNKDGTTLTRDQSSTYDITQDITDAPYSCVVDSDYTISLNEYVTTEPNDAGLNTRVSMTQFEMTPESYSFTPPPPFFAMESSYQFDDIQDALNDLKDIFNAIKANIDSNPKVFDRQYMFRDRFAKIPAYIPEWERELVPIFSKRVGDVLWVKGKGLKIGYGPMRVRSDSTNQDWEYEFLYEKNLTAGDAIEEKYFYLDQFDALYPGTKYYIMGKEFYYAAEFLKVP